MQGILITFKEPDQLAAIKAAAKRAGMTDRGWCRQILLAAAGMGQPSDLIITGEDVDAVAGLVGLGMDEDISRARVAAVVRKFGPELNTAQIIAQTFKEK